MWDLIVSVPDHCLSFYFKLLFGNWDALNQGPGGMKDVAFASVSHSQTQLNNDCSFQTLDVVFRKGLLLDYCYSRFEKKPYEKLKGLQTRFAKKVSKDF